MFIRLFVKINYYYMLYEQKALMFYCLMKILQMKVVSNPQGGKPLSLFGSLEKKVENTGFFPETGTSRRYYP